jgi:hypothetical protein
MGAIEGPFSVELVSILDYCTLRNNVSNSASVDNAATSLKITMIILQLSAIEVPSMGKLPRKIHTYTASSTTCSQVQSIRVNIKDHVGGVKTNDSVRVCIHAVKQLSHMFRILLHRVGLVWFN